jgi:glutamine synthetase
MRVCVEYVWIAAGPRGCVEPNLRSKTRVLNVEDTEVMQHPTNIPAWTYDGSSTNQRSTELSEVALTAVFVCPDPLRGTPHLIALCDTSANRTRSAAASLFTRANVHRDKPWFGLEQEYVLVDAAPPHAPLHWTQRQPVRASSDHYCGVGGKHAWGRAIAEEHLQACLAAGLTVAGMNAEVTQAQWEFQIGPVCGIRAADELWMARYLLLRVAEAHGAHVLFAPKPVPGFNGSGCHANFSTSMMRAESGAGETGTSLREMQALVEVLAKDHERLMSSDECTYGAGNEQRLIGTCETSSCSVFTWGVGDRTASVRIPLHYTGYIEDRRPAANADPYAVTTYLYSRYLAACVRMRENHERASQ